MDEKREDPYSNDVWNCRKDIGRMIKTKRQLSDWIKWSDES